MQGAAYAIAILSPSVRLRHTEDLCYNHTSFLPNSHVILVLLKSSITAKFQWECNYSTIGMSNICEFTAILIILEVNLQ